MDIKTELPSCEVCGCTSYTKVSGYYVCANCDTQSQEIQEQCFEYNENQRINEDEERVEIVSKEAQSTRPSTSWECYNLILKGLIQELIDLGASPRLRIVAFQIWATYLQKANLAFFSKQQDKLPLLPMGFKSSDAEVLYGISNLRRIIFKDVLGRKQRKRTANLQDEVSDVGSSSETSQKSGTSLRSLRIKQRKLAITKLQDSSENEDSIISHNESLQSLGSSKRSKSKKRLKIAFKSSTQKAIKQLVDSVKRAANAKNEEKVKRVSKLVHRRLAERKRNSNMEYNMLVSLTTLISILRMALLLLGDDILLGDILRWIHEGRLSANQTEKFLSSMNKSKFEVTPCNRNGSEVDMRNVTHMLGIRDLPTPNLYKLAERYCKDLCLPDEFLDYVHGLMNVFEPKMNYADYNFHVFPNYEGRVLGYILMAFKLLFSMDGLTEKKQSLFADHVNKCRATAPELPLLFSWTAWVQYIECRNALLSRYNPIVNAHAYKGRINNSDTFEQYWHKLNPAYETHSDPINRVFMSSTDKILEKALDSEPVSNIVFPASLTPNITNLQYLMENHSNLIPENSRSILEETYTHHSLLHLLDYDMCSAIAQCCKVKVEFVEGIAAVDMEKYKEPESILPTISNTGTVPAYVPIYVNVVNEPRKDTTGFSKYNDLKKFNYDFEVFTEPEPPSSDNTTFKIYHPHKEYWFFHNCHKNIHNDDFVEIMKENMSDSFVWLLRELANMIKCGMKDIYLELHTIESVLYSFLIEGDYERRCARVLLPTQW